MMTGLILGLGNPILSDDGVGLEAARRLAGLLPDLDVVATPLVGLELIDVMDGYDLVFVTDALIGPKRPPGEVRKLEDGAGGRHLFSSHGLDFFELIALGRTLGLSMPRVGGVYGLIVGDRLPFDESLSPELLRALPAAVEFIAADIRAVLAGGTGRETGVTPG